MLWPLILPFQITFLIMSIGFLLLVTFAPKLKLRRLRAALLGVGLFIFGFIPGCILIEKIIDPFRFGEFQYDSYEDISDFRSRRYLPPQAREIVMFNHYSGNGYRARYHISEQDFLDYLDHLWEKYGDYSVLKRDQISGEAMPTREGEIRRVFGDLGWPLPDTAVVYHSTTESDGGGAIYYVHAGSNTVLQSTGYW